MVSQNNENRTRNGHVLVWEQAGVNGDDEKPMSMYTNNK
jgi:hypothetical protein